MRVFRGFEKLPHFTRGVATIGSFDGVHRGHRVLLERVCGQASEIGGESVVFTFEPHPRITLGSAENLKLLNSTEEKLYLLERAGIENVIIIPFTPAFSRLSPHDFIAEYVAKIGIEYLIVGYNHRFGHNKSGDFSLLASSGNELHLKVIEVQQQLVEEAKVSSTVIRNVIAAGDMVRAEKLLDAPYLLIGDKAADGEIEFADRQYKLLPPAGRYKATVDGRNSEITITDDGRVYDSIVSPPNKGKTIIKFTKW